MPFLTSYNMKKKPIIFEEIITDGIWRDSRSTIFTSKHLKHVRKAHNATFGEFHLVCLRTNPEVNYKYLRSLLYKLITILLILGISK